MKKRYTISPKQRQEPTDAEIAKYRDPKKLVYNYQKAQQLLHKKPIYKDPKAFLVLLLIVLLAYFLSERTGRTESNEAPVKTELKE